MEAATESGTAEETKVVEESPAEDRSDEQVRQEWKHYVHVGDGAQECEHGIDGKCKNDDHFHVFCRLPNKLQINSIREKANAAKARALRAFRDPDSERGVILETDLETLRTVATKDDLIDEIVGATRWRDRGEVMVELAGEEEEFEHIDDDQERARVLNGMPEAERDQEEFERLTAHLEKWNAVVDERLRERQQPERDALAAKELDDIVEMIRDQRIKGEINDVWMNTYSQWEWYIGTLKPRPPEKGLPVDRVYSSIEEMKGETPERLDALMGTFEALENGTLSPTAKTAVRAEGN